MNVYTTVQTNNVADSAGQTKPPTERTMDSIGNRAQDGPSLDYTSNSAQHGLRHLPQRLLGNRSWLRPCQ